MSDLFFTVRTADILGATLALIIVISFWKVHHDRRNTFNLFDLIMEGGRLSRLACVFMGAFALYSWVIVRLTLDGKLTEGFIWGYGLSFVAPIIAKLFSIPPAVPEPGTTVVTDTTVVQKSKDVKSISPTDKKEDPLI